LFHYSSFQKIELKSLVNNEEETFNLKVNPAGVYYLKMDGKANKAYKIVLE